MTISVSEFIREHGTIRDFTLSLVAPGAVIASPNCVGRMSSLGAFNTMTIDGALTLTGTAATINVTVPDQPALRAASGQCFVQGQIYCVQIGGVTFQEFLHVILPRTPPFNSETANQLVLTRVTGGNFSTGTILFYGSFIYEKAPQP